MTSVTQAETIDAGGVARITVSPSTVSLKEGASQTFTATAVDQYTNPISGFTATWSATAGAGTVSPSKGATTTFTAGGQPASGTITATQGGVHGTATVTVKYSASLQFATSSQSLVAGRASTAMTLSLSAPAPTGGLLVSLSTSSAGGGFSTTASGTFGRTLSVSFAAGATGSGTFYYRDTTAGSPTLTATAVSLTPTTQTELVAAGTVARIAVSPSTVSLAEGASQSFSATGFDQYTNQISGLTVTWSAGGGTVSPSKGATTTFTAGGVAGPVVVSATHSGVQATASVTISGFAKPAAVVNSSTWMNTFYDSSSGNLMNEWWQSTSGWHDQQLASGMVGSPAAVVNSSTWMDVFYDSSSGNLMNEWWQSTSGWHDQQLASGMVGSPAAISRTSTSMDVFYESTSGQLMNAYWQSTSGWHVQALATGMAGAPPRSPTAPPGWTSSTRAPRASS